MWPLRNPFYAANCATRHQKSPRQRPKVSWPSRPGSEHAANIYRLPKVAFLKAIRYILSAQPVVTELLLAPREAHGQIET